MHLKYKQESWYEFLDPGMQQMVDQSYILIREELDLPQPRFSDYAYVLFPLARAYEGFLKKYMLQLDILPESQLMDKYFRIGRSLNPELPEHLQDHAWLFDDLERLCRDCGEPDLAQQMWDLWKEGRNQIFHYYFPAQARHVSLNEANQFQDRFFGLMKQAIECQVFNHSNNNN